MTEKRGRGSFQGAGKTTPVPFSRPRRRQNDPRPLFSSVLDFGTAILQDWDLVADEHGEAALSLPGKLLRMICVGIDAGSRTLKVVLIEPGTRRIVAAGVRDQGIDQDALACQLLHELLDQQGLLRQTWARLSRPAMGGG
jgi:hypothetical protein